MRKQWQWSLVNKLTTQNDYDNSNCVKILRNLI